MPDSETWPFSGGCGLLQTMAAEGERGSRHGFETCYRRDMDSREDRDMGLRLAIVETWIRERIKTWV